MLLNNLILFLQIAEKGSMAAAGRELGLSPATVSERLTSLETYYNARLLTRTTRSLRLTEEGQVLIEGAQRLLAEAEELETRIKLGVNKISGPVRVTAPIDLGKNRIAPMLNAFKQEHPEVNIDLYLDDGYVNLVSSGIDLAVRYGALLDSGLRIRKLADNRRIVCASPDYIAKHGHPTHPTDLPHHTAVLMRFGQRIDRNWHFNVDDKTIKIAMKSTCVANDGELVREWCKAGHGLALKSIWDIADDLESGQLVSLLNEYPVPSGQLQLVFPTGHTEPRRIRLLIDFIAKKFATDHIKRSLPAS